MRLARVTEDEFRGQFVQWNDKFTFKAHPVYIQDPASVKDPHASAGRMHGLRECTTTSHLSSATQALGSLH